MTEEEKQYIAAIEAVMELMGIAFSEGDTKRLMLLTERLHRLNELIDVNFAHDRR